MDPFSLIAAGVGTAGALAGGIYNAATLPAKKRKFKREQKQKLREDIERDWIARLSGGKLPMYDLDAARGVRDIDRAAEENFQFDPMTFVPFVQQGTKLAGGIYDAAGGGEPSEEDRLVNALGSGETLRPYETDDPYWQRRLRR